MVVLNRRILITGARGFTGRHACNYFAETGYEVIGLVRKPFSEKDVVIETGDLLDKDEVFRIVSKHMPDYCLHLAGINSVPQSWIEPYSTFQANVMSTLHLLEACRLIKPACRTLVIGSALSEANHPYAVSKHFQQNLALEWSRIFHSENMIAKPCNLIGPGKSKGFISMLAQKIAQMERIDRSEHIEVSHLGNAREFLDVRDAISAYEIILNRGETNTVYEIGSGKLTSLYETASVFQLLTNVQLSFTETTHKPDETPRLMNKSPLQELQWTPTINIEASIAETLAYYRNLNEST
jgi:GDP-4-dehydro-6-deoxy-D-mannose reductase